MAKSYHVACIWDAEGVHSSGFFELIGGGWKGVEDWCKARDIRMPSRMDNIYGDPVWWWPKMKRNVSFNFVVIPE